MPIPAWANERILREVAAFLAQEGVDPSLAEVVRRLRAWPVYFGWSAVLLLGPDGEVYCHDEDSRETNVESHCYWRRHALVAAAEAVPELAPLVPARPDGAADCFSCNGMGRFALVGQPERCGMCAGLGWLSPEEERAAREEQRQREELIRKLFPG